MNAVVLSNWSQYQKFLEARHRPGDFEVFCDNPRFYDTLAAQGVPYRVLDEIQMKESWAEINAWGCAQVSRWMKACQAERIFSQVDLASVVRHFFAMTLIPAVKNYRFAQTILSWPGFDRVLVFEPMNKRKFPFFSGNAYLNYFLKEEAGPRGIPVTRLSVYEKENREYVVPVAPGWNAAANAKKTLKKIFHLICLRRPRLMRKITVLAHGSLRHLSETIRELRKRGEAIALYDFEFHLEQFLFALKNRIPYLLPDSFGPAGGGDAMLARRYAVEFKAALALARRMEVFSYEGRDFSDFIERELFYGLEDYCLEWAKRTHLYEKMLETCGLRALVMDEDYALRGSFLAGFMKAKGLKLFCVSHANLGVDFSIPEADRIFHHSWTLVHSEFERDMYAVRGWDPSKFILTGIPRYDRLVRFSEQKRPWKKGKIRLLYTATGLWKFSPDQHGYLGCHFVCYGDFQVPAFRVILEAIEGLPIELFIKPHSAESVPYWRAFVRQFKVKNTLHVGNSGDDYFRMLASSDAMILSYWSTGLIEAALCGIPTFFVASPLFESPVLKQFSGDGYCHLVNDAASLRSKMRTLCQEGPDFFHKGTVRHRPEYYLNFLDGESTRRAAGFIQNSCDGPRTA
ncbi:MAG: hypothetical protein HYZ52_01155 [Candidatus Omnitrophica bacterium]|nr:hypothetical protein [Candidatus Omnitrophota bacterium]